MPPDRFSPKTKAASDGVAANVADGLHVCLFQALQTWFNYYHNPCAHAKKTKKKREKHPQKFLIIDLTR